MFNSLSSFYNSGFKIWAKLADGLGDNDPDTVFSRTLHIGTTTASGTP